MTKTPPTRQQIRADIRARRQLLTSTFQKQASRQLLKQLQQHSAFTAATHIALYLSNDGELDLHEVIQWCWQQGKHVYLPLIHPFSSKHLLFIAYEPSSTMKPNQFNILEPRLDQTKVLPIEEFDIICTPLVAFDRTGARLGMGGGFYDRTLAPLHACSALLQNKKPILIGLAHDCQEIDKVPTEAWDVPIPEIITPTRKLNCPL